jgi:hypothetical protein
MLGITEAKSAAWRRNIGRVQKMTFDMKARAEGKDEAAEFVALFNQLNKCEELILNAPIAEKSNRGRKAAVVVPANSGKKKK